MTTKSLTHIFMIMRDKSLQRRNIYQMEEGYGDRESLVSREKDGNHIAPPPDWMTIVEEVRYSSSTLERKTKKLHTLQSNLIRRPSLDDNNPEEIELANLSNEITKMLERCRSQVIQLSRVHSSGREKNLKESVVKALMITLQDINAHFSASCAAYTQSMQSMKQNSSFGVVSATGSSIIGFDDDPPDEESQQWGDEQMQFLADNQSAVIASREKAVQSILKSTLHLNQLFRDVAHLVHQQGSIVDRIDCNIESASVRVKDGTEQLVKARNYQKKNRNLKCIIGLAVSIVVLMILLIIVKS